jgi:DNA ligase (NAD+)
VAALREELAPRRPTLPYDIDGLVVKARAIDLADASRPRPDRQIAFKFDPEEGVTVIRAVEWHRSGATYTPIALFDPVLLAGTTGKRASLVNPDMIRSLGVQVGSTVVVTKRGDIIPKVERVVGAASPVAAPDNDGANGDAAEGGAASPAPTVTLEAGVTGAIGGVVDDAAGGAVTGAIGGVADDAAGGAVDGTAIEFPTHCTVCGAELADEGTRLLCPNRGCPARIEHRIEKWVGVMDIRDLGAGLLEKLFAAGRLRSISDLYTLTEEELTPFFLEEESLGKGKASKGAQKVAAAIGARREVSLAAFVAGFDIEGIGEVLVERLVAGGFDTLEKLFAAPAEELANVNGFGATLAAGLTAGLRENADEMRSLVVTGTVTIGAAPAGKLAGRSFCFTGELGMKRGDAEALVKAQGGTVKNTVGKGLSYLVTNDPQSGSAKNKKAASPGIPVIGEEKFLALVQ